MVILSGRLIEDTKVPGETSRQTCVERGARVILRRNMDIEGGWVNGTLAVVTSMYPSCIVITKLANPSHKFPIPRFCQRIEIHGAT